MANRKSNPVNLKDLRHALAVAIYFAERAPPGDDQNEFAYLTMLLRQYVEYSTLDHALDDEERLRLHAGAHSPRGKA